ncbi:serine proteinase stubble isoform X2 [Macrobrachium rosenbergii]|uniref:serine proteinase stubble isoform X2 n=1 Tax=Macrobrachium rosenbergii TaxID=79674 RepID=UPI0034D3B620
MKARRTSQQTLMLWYMCCWSLAAAITLTAAHPLLYLRGTRYGYGRNIRPLGCVSKTGEKGVCMFAWDCMKANGTHLGTCIDRFYFGSCCKMNNVIPTAVPVTGGSGDTTPVGGHSSMGQPSSDEESKVESSSEHLSASEVLVLGSTSTEAYVDDQGSAPGHVSTVGHTSTQGQTSTGAIDGSMQFTGMTTIEMPTSTDKTTSAEEQTSDEQTSIHGETPSVPEETSNEVLTNDGVISIQGASWQEPAVTTLDTVVGSVTSSVHPNEIIEETGTTLTTPFEIADPMSSTTEVNVAVDPKPMQPEITSPGVTGVSSSTSVGEETSAEFPEDLSPTTLDFTETPENQPSTPDMASVTPVSAPATEVPDTGVNGETQTEKTTGSVATITIEETKTPTSTEIPEIVSISIDTTSSGPDDSEMSKPTVHPPTETTEAVTTLQQELFTEESTQPPRPSDLLPPVISPIVPGSIFPAAATQEPGITTWIPISSTEHPSVGTNFPIVFPGFPSTTNSTAKPVVDVFTDKPELTTTGKPATEESGEVTEKPDDMLASAEDTDRPTTTEVTDTSSESDSSEVGDTVDMTTTVIPHSTQSPEDELLNRLNTSSYKDICGTPVYPTKRIVGGSEATFGEWPWQVSLRQWRQVTFLHKCGAALLNENWAITAAHCVENVQPDELLLRLGEFDLETSEEPYPFTERKVQIVATHPQFDPRTFEYDLALLRFQEPVNFLPNIIPICVPQDDYTFINDTGYVTGWGRLYEDGPLHAKMQKVEVPVISNEDCRQMFLASGGLVNIPNIMMCAGYAEGKRDACEGDSGGPLVIQRSNGKWYLAGVISWGIGCALPNQPGVYTRISEFREWIEKIIVF